MKNNKYFMILAILAIFTLFGCNNQTNSTQSQVKGAATTNQTKEEAVPDSTVVFETSLGNFEVALNGKKAPKTVKNFLGYVKSGFYEKTIFHRVINDFMVQGGGFDTDLNQKKTKGSIANEATNGLKNSLYTIAMARTQKIDSATSQFFINVADNSFLDHRDDTTLGYGYAVFGKVTTGTDVIDKIKAVTVGPKGNMSDVPLTPVIIQRVYVKK
jgi:peptidyl-prolyl cis-trans isomerase B (cyclophilin B)